MDAADLRKNKIIHDHMNQKKGTVFLKKGFNSESALDFILGSINLKMPVLVFLSSSIVLWKNESESNISLGFKVSK